MSEFSTIFNRYEKKYLLTGRQYDILREEISPYVHADNYGDSIICSLYFDTKNFRLIRASMQAPTYKEKLRLRCYGVPDDDKNAFVEMKKKYKSVVYKRRVGMSYAQAFNYLVNGTPPPVQSQITNEIDYMRNYYGGLFPQMAIFCERTALYENFNDDLRLTFDRNIRWRNENLDLKNGTAGESILSDGEHLLEIKTTGAMPLWLAESLNKNEVYPLSFSKYAKGFTSMITNKDKKEELFGGIICA